MTPWMGDQPVTKPSPTQNRKTRMHMRAFSRIRTHDPSDRTVKIHTVIGCVWQNHSFSFATDVCSSKENNLLMETKIMIAMKPVQVYSFREGSFARKHSPSPPPSPLFIFNLVKRLSEVAPPDRLTAPCPAAAWHSRPLAWQGCSVRGRAQGPYLARFV
jgi:hypothetical protein